MLLIGKVVFAPSKILRSSGEPRIERVERDWKGALFGLPAIALIFNLNQIGALYREGYAWLLAGAIIILAFAEVALMGRSISRLSNAGKVLVFVLWIAGPAVAIASLFLEQHGDRLFLVGAFYVSLPPFMLHMVRQVQRRTS